MLGLFHLLEERRVPAAAEVLIHLLLLCIIVGLILHVRRVESPARLVGRELGVPSRAGTRVRHMSGWGATEVGLVWKTVATEAGSASAWNRLDTRRRHRVVGPRSVRLVSLLRRPMGGVARVASCVRRCLVISVVGLQVHPAQGRRFELMWRIIIHYFCFKSSLTVVVVVVLSVDAASSSSSPLFFFFFFRSIRFRCSAATTWQEEEVTKDCVSGSYFDVLLEDD